MELQQSKNLKDPVCGMDVTESSEHHHQHAQKDHYFCSEHCLIKFKNDPEHYLTGAAPKVATETDTAKDANNSNIYTCPMHPEIRQEGPGSCPKCGMALEPETISVVATKTEYACPMHPEIVQDHPGSCPKCGMALEPMTATVEEKNEEDVVVEDNISSDEETLPKAGSASNNLIRITGILLVLSGLLYLRKEKIAISK